MFSVFFKMPVTIDKSLPVPRIDRKRCDSNPSYQRYNTDTAGYLMKCAYDSFAADPQDMVKKIKDRMYP